MLEFYVVLGTFYIFYCKGNLSRMSCQNSDILFSVLVNGDEKCVTADNVLQG